MLKYKGYTGYLVNKGYTGYVVYDDQASTAIKAVITRQGKTVDEDSVDDYLEWCKERKKNPEETVMQAIEEIQSALSKPLKAMIDKHGKDKVKQALDYLL